MTAQAVFAAMLRDHVAPALRDLGLKGSGQTFTLPDAASWALIAFQKSAWSSSSSLSFTANLTVANKTAWADARTTRAHLPERPAPNRFYGAFLWQSRIGPLMPGGEDHWWRLDEETAPTELAEDVVQAIRDYGLPVMRVRLG